MTRNIILFSKFARIKLDNNEFALVDIEDVKEVKNYKWYITKKYKVKYAIARVRVSEGGKEIRKHILLHRLIMNAPKGSMMDHINGNGLDCRKTNLRFVTHQENMQNFHARRGKSEYRGVDFFKPTNKWRARMRYGNRERKNLGYFDNQEDAALAYDKAIIKYRKTIIGLNFPEFALEEIGLRS